MPNLRVVLTEAICERARPEAREYALRDLQQAGLSLRVRPSGARTWIVRCREEGKQVKHSVGSHPEVSLKAARQAAANALLLGSAAPKRPPSPTLRSFQKEHEYRHCAAFKPAGLQTYRSYVRNQLVPAFGRKRLDAITRRAVVHWFEGYSIDSPGGANRAIGILGQMLECAKAWGHFPPGWINPTVGIRHNRRRVVGTFLSEAQMVRLGAILTARIDRGCAAVAILRFLTLTGCRVGEAIALEWDDILPDRLRLRDSKTGPRDVPLGGAVTRFLNAYRLRFRGASAMLGGGTVFPLPVGNGYEYVRTAWLSVRSEADLPPTLRIHDLRHSFASHAIMSGESLLTVSRLLGHSRIQTTARYAHLADDVLLARAERIGALIMAQALSR
jgi:integrase